MSTPLEIALDVAEEAGRLLVEGMGRRHAADAKRGRTDLVTEYDKRSEALIVARLRQAFPGDQVLAEEGGLTGAPAGATARRWLVDPLDGTTNFAHGLPFFVVSIGLEVGGLEAGGLEAGGLEAGGLEAGGVLEVGVVAAPALGMTFAAARGAGATLNGNPLRVSDAGDLGAALLATGFPYDRQTSEDNNFAQFIAFQRRAQGVRRVGAAALDLALTAQGAFDGYWEMKLKPWDVAAGALIVLEAGGRVTGWQGEPLSLERGAVVASNGRIHDAMLAVLAETGIPAPARGT